MALDDIDAQCINCWSGPRCCSTSLMYAFAQRPDTQVLDEPLYANYLRLSGSERPYTELVMATQLHDGHQVVREQLLGAREKPVLYAKHIAKQKIGIGSDLWRRAQHLLLVRDPYSVIESFAKVLPPTLAEIGYSALLEIYSELRAIGRPPIVIISDDLVRAPEAMLRGVCSALGLPFHDEMLQWPAGPKPCDGVWAPWWYRGTHASTGFDVSVRSKQVPLPPELTPLLEECWDSWLLLRRHAFKPPDTSVPRNVAGSGGSSSSHKTGTHVYVPDPRNASVLIGIRDGMTLDFQLVPRSVARVSVFDSAFMLGDGVWEGIRVHKRTILFARAHIERLLEGAKALDMDLRCSPQQLLDLVYETLDANQMDSGVHVRLMASRGLKPTPYQAPATTLGAPTIVVAAEHKAAASAPKARGIRLFTVHVRRGGADVQDPSWNSHSKLNCIAACIQASKAGADEGLMLDPQGFVATCNSTNFFCVRRGEVWAPTTKYQLHGITRANVLRLCRDNGIPAREADFSLTHVYSCEEAFVTGTFAGVLPVTEVDGRQLGDGTRGPVTERLQQLYLALVEQEAAAGRVPW